ncbi:MULTISPECIES: amino acid ABC transporter permease [Aerococcus]|uniref:amino acid ABC transporter permease n=1 Tax=Aerococcus TaxID=1375 RepID=UPI000DCD18CB|nr:MULTISPECIES: amino acid ABC transporter permease [Aerococcus]KAA9297129.1 amino acid ABC transporter permease [Aerococcus tenax]MDK6688877.1 amino acid ABC transporter permease [Aerococcus urinae]MDK8133572.1 amino acid ABC transporter permease [Aerococcus urinae]MDK8485226.1 amino acid ABC transporter permease [Aerococcus urinae]MDL5179021.1 amino acid ABC transporter permease [Aerococcus tenax]
MDFGFIINILPTLLKTLPLTLFVFVVALVGSLLLAVIVASLQVKKIPIVDPLLRIYSSFMRSTPGIIHLFVAYYGIPFVLRPFHISLGTNSQVTAAIIALVAYNGAFMAEIIRPAYLAVGQDQKEAALSLGMTSWQRNWRIIFPQIIPIALPSLTTAVIDLLKDTSLLFLIGLVDLMGQAEIIIANNYGLYQVEVYFAIALIYWAMSSLLILISKLLENRYAMIWRRED